MYMEDICTNLFCLKKNHLLILCYPSTTTMLSSQVWSYKVSSSHLKVSHSVLFLLIAQPVHFWIESQICPTHYYFHNFGIMILPFPDSYMIYFLSSELHFHYFPHDLHNSPTFASASYSVPFWVTLLSHYLIV